MRFSVFALAALLSLTASAFADPVDVTQSRGDGSVPTSSITITFAGLPTNPVTGALVDFTVKGDFNSSSEYIDISMDGLSFGRWLDNNVGNDSIAGPTGDAGNEYDSQIHGSVAVPLASLAPRLADGALAFTFNYSSNVTNLQSGDLLRVRVRYVAGYQQVPEPAFAALFAGAAGIIALRRRRRAA